MSTHLLKPGSQELIKNMLLCVCLTCWCLLFWLLDDRDEEEEEEPDTPIGL